MTIKNMCTIKKMPARQRCLFLVMLIAAFYLNPAFANMYKCIDENNNISYIDTPCLDMTRQELDIVVAPVDEAALERLRESRPVDFPDPKIKNQVIVLEKERISKQCEGLIKQIQQLKKQQNSGYTASQGEQLEKTIDGQRKNYDKFCK